MVSPRRAIAALGLVAATLGACGGDDASRETGSTTTTEGEATTTTSATTTTTTATSSSSTTEATTSTTRGTTVTAEPDPTVPPPAFTAVVSTVTASDLYASWHAGCPVPVEQLRAIDASHWGFDGRVHTGRLIVAANDAQAIVDVLSDLYAVRYPIERMQPIDVYGGDDNKSISANNTSAFNCRAVTGGTGWSEHAFGRAIDVNPFVNPYVKGGTILPPEAAPFADRSRHDPGMIHAGDAVVQAFADRGWKWGGYWSSLKDYQHFSTTGR